MTWLDAHAPFRYAADWDNCGLQVGDPRRRSDLHPGGAGRDSPTLREAETNRCQCLVTHHPLLFQPLKTLRFDQSPAASIIRAIKNGIHLIAAHTNLDAARDGTNQQLVRMLGLEHCHPLET